MVHSEAEGRLSIVVSFSLSFLLDRCEQDVVMIICVAPEKSCENSTRKLPILPFAADDVRPSTLRIGLGTPM